MWTHNLNQELPNLVRWSSKLVSGDFLGYRIMNLVSEVKNDDPKIISLGFELGISSLKTSTSFSLFFGEVYNQDGEYEDGCWGGG